MAAVREIVRQGKKDLTLARNLVSSDGDILLAGGAVNKIVTSWYSVAVTYGVSKVMRMFMESGRASFEEWSHNGINLRFRAGAMGVPFLPTLSQLGSDIIKFVDAKTMTCPYTGEKLCLVPAIFPNVAMIHVQKADAYGNVQIDGFPFIDADVAYSSEKVIVTTEEIVSSDVIRSAPDRTAVPFFCVDAVVKVPYGAYPHECYGHYEADYAHLQEYVDLVEKKGEEGMKQYMAKYVYGPASHEEFLELFPIGNLLKSVRNGRMLAKGE